jgi:hypothetical protein
VEYRGEGLDAVDQAGAGTDHDAVGVDRPDRHAGQRPGRGLRLLDRAGQVVAARRDDDQLGCRRGDVSPAHRDRRRTRAGGDGLAARRADQIGYPVPGGERRIHPFDHRGLRAPPPGDGRRGTGEPGPQLAHQPRGALRHAGPLPDRQDRVQHLAERVRVEREHVSLAAQVAQGVFDLAGRQRAHAAQVLGEDQVGPQIRERAGVQRVQVGSGGELRADVAVDLRGGHPAGVPATHDDRLFRPGGRRLVAPERDPDQVLAQAERVHDLGRRGQQRDQTHKAQDRRP